MISLGLPLDLLLCTLTNTLEKSERKDYLTNFYEVLLSSSLRATYQGL